MENIASWHAWSDWSAIWSRSSEVQCAYYRHSTGDRRRACLCCRRWWSWRRTRWSCSSAVPSRSRLVCLSSTGRPRWATAPCVRWSLRSTYSWGRNHSSDTRRPLLPRPSYSASDIPTHPSIIYPYRTHKIPYLTYLSLPPFINFSLHLLPVPPFLFLCTGNSKATPSCLLINQLWIRRTTRSNRGCVRTSATRSSPSRSTPLPR